MKEKNETIYIKADRSSVCREPHIRLQDVMSVQCADAAVCAAVKNKTLYHFEETKGKKRIEVFSVLKVIALIQQDFPQAEIVNCGETDFVVQYVKKTEVRWLEMTKLAVMLVVIFLGAAFTIMAFNNDVAVGDVFARFYGQVMGTDKPRVTEIEIAYCLGLAVGILVFFNHIGQKKITPDPTPIQVQMRKYEQDVDSTFIENAGRKGHEHDVL